MNCNTTHYRANSSSVPGDPTACGRCYDGGAQHCPDDGTALRTMRVARRLSRRYHLDRRLGRGGMGTVYDAHDVTLDRRVAVKLVRDELADQTDAATRFAREARTAARFNHPNVVTVFDYGVAGSQAYIVMERLDGQTLRDVLQATTCLDGRRTLHLLRDIAAAVDAAHTQGLLHLDLKPENVYLVADGSGERAKVLDFGLAQVRNPQVGQRPLADTILVGTPSYMAPEQLCGEPPEAGADLWAVVIMAFEMLTGMHPFARVTRHAEAFALDAPDESPAAALSPAVRAFFARTLSLDRSQRPSSAGAFVDQLERHVLEGSGSV